MNEENLESGQDAFLDIIANLVGILIILIVIVGAHTAQQAKSSITSVDDDSPLHSQIETAVLLADQQSDLVHRMVLDNESLEQQIDEEKSVAQQLTDVRHRRLVELETLRQRMREEESKLAKTDRQQLKTDLELQSLAEKRNQLQETLNAISASGESATATETIEHYPNPIARTVFSREVHFQLSAGRLTYVPLDELVARMKQTWKSMDQASEFDRTRQTIGPIGNYRLQYELGSTGTGRQRQIRFRHFTLLPVNTSAGEQVATALGHANSQWQRKLQDFEPDETTVSIWVHPDSYAQHSDIKRWLHDRGFQMASWPLQEGRFITGGPQGFKTSAQ